ncbi:MAG: phenylalanine--tRNA ligase subunit beta [Candidatus Cloacimonetes bacterium 4572_55]|nr:MAG: phenylalanine--tRNA ligase subunit beta [Candidatus Cloacimonetes bacterium 4572_55]
MQISYKWLQDYIKIGLQPAELARRLTTCGLETTNIRYLGEGLDRVVVGEITEIEKHPHADHLFLCAVETGVTGEDTISVICGSPNTRVGLKSAFVPPDVTLPTGISVKEAQIRGVVSSGMLCSEKDLGISTDHSGIIELGSESTAGQSIVEAIGLDDYALELDLTANRPDTLSHYGVAREISAMLNLPLQSPNLTVNENDRDAHSLAKITIQHPNSCPRYAARVITGVKIGPSPRWLRERLIAIGQRPINNVVDITNFVLFELGHPLHAFDYDEIAGHHINVRHALDQEQFTTLDNVAYTLTPETLMITDENGGIAVAGIMGGLHSEVTEKTRNILLESAYFNPQTIRVGCKLLNKKTESSHRFERGTDPENVIASVNRAAQLIVDIAGGETAKGIIDAYPKPILSKNIHFRLDQTKRILGVEIPTEKIYQIFTSLGFQIEQNQSDSSQDQAWQVVVPTWRQDVEREIDLIEEIARHYGYDHIPDRLILTATTQSNDQKETARKNKLKDIARQFLTGSGYNEFITNSFVNDASFERSPQFGIDPQTYPLIRIKNPLTFDHNCLRPSLLTTVLPQIRENIHRKNTNLKIFEIGTVFQKNKQTGQSIERTVLGLFLCGDLLSRNWQSKAKSSSFYDLKGTTEDLFSLLQITGIKFTSVSHAQYHPYRCAEIRIHNERIGSVGELNSKLSAAYDIETPAYWAEIDFQLLTKKISLGRVYQQLPRYPALERDFALVMDEKTPYEPIRDRIHEIAEEYLENMTLFDVYHGAPLPEGKKSIAFSMTFRTPGRTLVDEEIDRLTDRILQAVEKEFQAVLRG